VGRPRFLNAIMAGSGFAEEEIVMLKVIRGKGVY
jgi:hypothetical protein